MTSILACLFGSAYKGCALDKWFATSGTITDVILIRIATVVSSLSLCAACLPNKEKDKFENRHNKQLTKK
jgi:hypothetical protein